jgi:hypothetical protein
MGAVAVDACHNDDIPSLLGSPLLRKRELHLGRDCSNEGIQRPSILVVIDVAVSNCLPNVPHLEPYSHHCGPLDVVGLGEGRSPAAGTDVPDNGLDPMMTMVPVRGGRVAPPVKAAISVNPIADASAPVWAAAAIGDTTATLVSLSSLSLSSSAETKLSMLLARRALSSAATAAASTSALAAASSAIVSLVVLAAVAAVSAAARSRSSAAATSASCRCCVLKTIELLLVCAGEEG